MAPFAFHDNLRPRHCHACPDPHPMDVICFVSHCPTYEHLVQTYIQCWRPPFTTVPSQWWSATTHVNKRRNFVQRLVPISLYTKLTTPPSGRRKPAHCHDFKLALKDRVPLLLNALYRTLEWLNDPPPPPLAPLTPPKGPQLMGTPLVALQHVTHRPTAPPTLPTTLPPHPGQGCTQASKAPPPPIPCGTHQSSKTRLPAPKARLASIAETQYRKPTLSRAPAPQTAAHNQGHVQSSPSPSTSTPPRRLCPRFLPFSPHNEVLSTSPPLPREHKLTIVLTFVQRVISLKKPNLHVSLTPALDSPNSAQPISTTTLALPSHFCK